MSRRLEELERAKTKLEALVRAAVGIEGDSEALAAWQDVAERGLVERATHALARVYAAIDIAEREAAR